MTVLNRNPENTNLLQPTKFLLTFDRIPDVTYFCQEANIPGISIPAIVTNTPGGDYHVAGNKATYNMFTVKFMVSENVSSWKNIHSWMMSIASPHGTNERNYLTAIQSQSKTGSFPQYSDATLTVLSNLNNPILRVHLVGLFPISLSDIQFDTTLSADHIITADATFSVKYFDFIDV